MSEGGTTWGLRALALGLALTAWFFVSYADRERLAEATIDPFVQYTTAPDHIILDPLTKVQVRLRGPASRIASLTPVQVGVVVDLRDASVGASEVNFNAGNVVAPSGLEVVSIDPNQVTLQIDRVTREMKPVDARLVGEPAAGAIAQDPVVSPPSVLVSGPESRLRQITSLSTSAVRLDGHALDFEEQAVVVSPDPLVRVMQPTVVTVRVPMEIPNTGGNQRQ